MKKNNRNERSVSRSAQRGRVIAAVLVVLLMGAGILYLAMNVQAVQIRNVQSVTTNAASSVSLVLTDMAEAVDTSNAFILQYVEMNAANTYRAKKGGEGGEAFGLFTTIFEESTILNISRLRADDISYETVANVGNTVVEFSEGVRIFSGTATIGATVLQRNITLPQTIDRDKTMVLLAVKSGFLSKPDESEHWTFRGTFPDSNTLRLERLRLPSNDTWYPAPTVMVQWQAVEFQSDAVVKSGTVTLPAGSTSVAVTLTEPISNINKAFLIFNYMGDSSIAGVKQDLLTRGMITDEYTLTFTRGRAATSPRTIDIAYYVVELTDSTSLVQRGNTPLATTSGSATLATEIDVTRSFPFISTSVTGGTALSLSDAWVRASLTGPTTLSFSRMTSAIATNIDWFVVEFPPLKVTAPNGGEVWRVGETQNITWKHAASLESGGSCTEPGYIGHHLVNILLSVNNGATYDLAIATGVRASANTYAWTIPDAIDSVNLIGEQLKVRVIDADMSERNYDDSNAAFIVKGQLAVYQPPNTWRISETQNISWHTRGNLNALSPANLTIKLSTNGGESFDHTITTAATPGLDDTDNSYAWEIPSDMNGENLIGTDNRLQLVLNYDPDSPNTTVTSASSNFTLKGRILNVSPNSNEVWLLGDTQTITWDKRGRFGEGLDEGTVNIYYSRNDGLSYDSIPIASDVPAGTDAVGGSYEWTIPSSTLISNPLSKLKVVNAADATVFAESSGFTLVASLDVDRPIGGEIWRIGQTENIEWTPHGEMEYVVIKYKVGAGDWDYVNGAAPANFLPAGNPGVQQTFSWLVPDHIGINNVYVRVCNRANENVYDEAGPLSIKGFIGVDEPAAGETINLGATKNILWNVSGTMSGNANIRLSKNSGSSYDTLIDTVDLNADAYAWTPSQAHMGSNNRIKVALDGDEHPLTGTAGESGIFSVEAALTLSYPNAAGLEFAIGDTVYIKWTPNPEVFGTVNIRYSTDGGINYNGFIADGIASNNIPAVESEIGYKWVIQDVPGMVGSSLRVKVYQAGKEEKVFAASNYNFKVKGSLNLTGPDGGETWYVGEYRSITWTKGGDVGALTLTYSTTAGADNFPHPIATGVAADALAYSWLIPDAIGTQLKVKAVQESDTSTQDQSQDVFSIKGRIVLSAPVGGETWYVGTQENISWTTYGTIDKVNLYYSRDSGNIYDATIFTNLTNAGGYLWTIPDAIGTNVRVKVESFYDSTVFGTSANDFTIKGRLVLHSPSGGEIWKVGETRNVTWTAYGSIANVALLYSINSGASYDGTITTGTPAINGTFPWEIPDIIGTVLKVKVVDVLDSTVSAESENVFRVVGTLTITAPNGNETFYVGDSTDITWTKTGTLGNVELRYSTDGGDTYPESNVIVTGIASTATPHSWMIPDALGGQTRVKVFLLSDPENVLDESNANFTIKGKLTVTAPVGGEVWEVGSSRSITWTRTGSIANVELRYSIDSGSTYANVIIASTPAETGSYPWLIPNDISNSVKVRVADASDTLVQDESDAVFSIKGKVILLRPNGGETLSVGETYKVDWTTAGTIAKVNLKYSIDAGTNYPNVIVNALDNFDTHNWTVPDAIGSQLRVRVENTDDTAVFDASDNNFTIKGTVTLTSPNGGETWVVGDLRAITWTKQGTLGNVKIEYSINGGATYDHIIAGEVNANDLSYPWEVTDGISNNARVKITSLSDTSVNDESNAVFTVKGSIRVTSPNGGEALPIGGSYDITWVRTGSIGNIRIDYSTDSGSTYPFVVTTSTGSAAGIYEWNNIPNTPTTQARVKLTSLADETVTDASDIDFRIRGAVWLTSPNGGETWIVGTSENITWTKTGSIPSVVLEYSTNSGSTYPNLITTTDGEALSFGWTIPDQISNTVRVRIRNASDATVFDTSNADFSIKGAVTMVSPNGGEVYVVDSAYDIRWSYVGTIPNVKLMYSRDGGSTFPSTIISSTPAVTLAYEWTVPDDITNQLVVRVLDAGDESVYDDSNAFAKIKGGLTVTSPNGGEAWVVGEERPITWTRRGSVGVIRLEYSTDGGESYPHLITGSYDSSLLSFAWTVPDDPTIQGRVKITSLADSTVTDASNNNFSIRGSLTLTLPVGGEVWIVNETRQITWTKFGSINTVKLEYSTNGGTTFPNVITNSVSAAALSYNWLVPDAIGSQLRVRITSNDDANVNDTSGADFEIKGSVTITSPNGSEIWYVNENRNITWIRTGSVSVARLEYSQDGGATYADVITPTVDASLGTYEWTIPDAIGNQLRVKITNTSDETVADASNANFYIKGRLTLTSPSGGQTWIVGESRNITWTRTGSIENVKLDYSTDGGTSYPNPIIASTPAAAGSYSWAIPDAIGINVRVRVSDATDSSVFSSSANDFEIKGSLTITSPNGGEEWVVGSSQAITWTKTGTITTVELRYSLDGGATYPFVISSTVDGGALSHPWIVPDDINSTVRIRIVNVDDASVFDISNSNFKIAGSLTVTSPNGAEEWVVGTTRSITWTRVGSIANVKIDYSTDSGATYEHAVVGSTPAAGLSYAWEIPNAVHTSVRVRVADAGDVEIFDTSNANFTIMPGFRVISPNGNEVWAVASSQDIAWETTGSCSNVKLEYSVNSGTDYQTIIASTPNTEIYAWTVPDDLSISCKVRVSDVANPTARDATDGLFKIRGSLTVTRPNGGESWGVADVENITWTRFGSIANVKLEYSVDGGLTYPESGLIVASTDASVLSYAWTIPDAVYTTIRVKITDTADSSVWDASNNNFTIKGRLTLLTPNGGEDLEVGSAYAITWQRFGSIANVKLEYSTNGGTTYPNVIIAATDAAAGSYGWGVPDAISQNCRVKVSDADNALVFDASESNFTIKGTVTVTAPNGGQVWYVGDVQNIAWTKMGSISTVKLEYSTNAFSDELATVVISASEDATLGTPYAWTVPDAIGGNVKVRVTDTSNATVRDVSDTAFSIKGKLSLTSPNGGQVWYVGENRNITWTRTGSIQNVRLDYSTDGGTLYNNPIIASTPAAAGSYAWSIPDAIGMSVKVRVSDASDSTVFGSSANNFEIKGVLTLVSPNGGEEWVVGSSQNITWSRNGTITTVELRYSLDGGATYPTVIAAAADGMADSYAWTIPDQINATMKVKVTNVDDESVFDVSNSNFKIVGSLTVTSPNGAEEWVVGTTRSITWTRVGSIANVKIDYSTDSGASYPYAVVGSTPAAGLSYAWEIPNAVHTSVRVRVADAGDVSVFDASDADFTIMPGFRVISPNGNEVWAVASSQDIAWETTGSCSNVKLEYSVNSGTDYQTIIASTPNTEIYAWTVPDDLSISCKVRVSDVANPTARDATDGLFKIRGSLTLTSPNGYESWDVASVHDITWTRFGSIANVKLEYSIDGGLTYPESGLIAASTDASVLSYVWTIPDNLSTTVRVKVTDTADATVFDASNNNFTIKGAVTLTSPNGGEQLEVGVPTTVTWTRFGSISNVKLEFSTDGGLTYPHLITAATDAGAGSYVWSVPDHLSTTVRVKVTDADNALVFDTSDADLSIRGKLTIGVPNGGEVWLVGETRNITWLRNGSIPTVRLEYSTDGGASYPHMIAPSLDATLLSYAWTVPDALGTQTRVRITDIANTAVMDASDNNFTIKGQVFLTSPSGGEVWIVNNVQNIEWNRNGSIANVKLEYSRDAGATYPHVIAASTDAGTGRFSWTIPDAIGTQLRVRISDVLDATVSDTSDLNFQIKGALLLTSPNGGEAWGVGTSQNITWTRTGSIANVKLEYSLDGGVTFPTTIMASTDGATGSYVWSIPDNPSTTVKVRVSDALDASVFDISDSNFKIVGSLTILQPNGGELWNIGGPQRKIAWSMVGSIPDVKLEYSVNGGANYDYLITASTPAGGLEYYWTIPDTATTQARVKVSDASDITVFDVSDANFSIQATFSVTSPNGGEVWVVGDSEEITWTTVGSVATVHLSYSVDSGASFPHVINAAASNTGTAAWEIPDALSAAVRVKVADVNDGQAFDTSNANFKIRGNLLLTSPAGGETLFVGNSHTITWSRLGSISTVRLSLSTNSGLTYPVTIASTVDAAAGSYDWTVPDAISNLARVRVNDTSDATVLSSSASDFNIKGSLTVTSPNGGQQWVVGTGETITWTRTGSIANVSLAYSTNSGATFPHVIVASTDASTGTYGWAIPDALSTTLRVRVANVDDASVFDISDADFMIKGSLTLISPNGGEIWYVGENRPITWTRSGSIPAVKLEYSTNSGSSYDTVIITSTDAAAGTYSWSVPNAIGSGLRVKVTDTANATVFDTSNEDFTIKGVLTLNVPNGGETWTVGSIQNITWTPTGTIPLVKLEYSINAGSTYPHLIIAETDGMAGSYAWTVADAIGANLKVRVTDASDPSVFDVSENTFAVKGSLTVTAPNGGEAWGVGTSQNITWTRTGSIATVKIEYSTDGGSTYPSTIIATTDAASGIYAWNVPDDISTQVRVRIINNSDPTVQDASDTNFKIVGVLNLTSPDSAEEWGVGENHNITWTRVGSVANVRLDYSTNSGASYPNAITASTPAGALSFTWNVPDAVSQTVRVRVADASDVSVFDTSSANFTIKARFDITSPDGGEVWTVGSSQEITWTTIGSTSTVRLDYSTDSGGTFPHTITGSTSNTGSFAWTVPDAISPTVRVRVQDYNNANAFSISQANFKIRGGLTVLSPNGGESWLVGSSQNITWSMVGTIENVKLEYSANSGADYPYTIAASVDAAGGSYAWTIPDRLTQNARVKITDTTDATVYDTSNNDFTIRGAVQLISPVGGEEWEVDSVHNIVWSRTGSIVYVRIDYSTNGGITYPNVIAASVDASIGSYPWAVPDTISTQIRVRVMDTANTAVFDSSAANFKIKGALRLVTPNGGEVWEVGTNNNITWLVTGSIANVRLDYSVDSGATYPHTVAANVVAASGSYTWTVPDNLTTQARVKITNLADLTVFDESGANFDIVGKLIVSSPNGGEVWPVGSSQAISWVAMGSIVNVRLELSTNGGVSFPYLIVDSVAAASGSFSWLLPDQITVAGRVRISDTSNPAVVNDISDGNFKIRGDLTLTSPNGGEVLLIDSNHSITWTRFGSITNAKLEYSNDGGATYPFTIVGSVAAADEVYSWRVPDNPGIQNRVRISDAADPTVFDTSNGNFTIRGGFTLLSPNGGEALSVGSEHDITWTTFGAILNVRLAYSSNNGANWTLITSSTPNTDIYPWTIPDRISMQCLVRVSDAMDAEAFDVSDAVFKIHGTLTLTSPNGGEEWGVATSQYITWTRVGSIAGVKLEYAVDGGVTYPYLIAEGVAGGLLQYEWTVPDRIGNNLKVRISDNNDVTIFDVSNAVFKIKGDFTVLTPNGGETWIVGETRAISWTTSGTVENVRLDYSTNGGSSWTIIQLALANTGSYNWNVPDAISDQCRIRVANAADSSAMDISDNNFKIRGDLQLTAPVGGETWPVGSNRIISWNRVGSIANVVLEYSDNNGINFVPITPSAPNTGSYSWVVPDAITTQALVRITNAADLTVTDTSASVFKIQGSFTVTSPNGGEAWMVTELRTITWTWNGSVPFVKLEFSIDSGAGYTLVADNVANTGVYEWIVPDAVSGRCRVRVSDAIDSEAYDISNGDFRIRCAFNLTRPNGGEQWRVGTSQTITWVNVGTAPTVTLQYSRDNFFIDAQLIASEIVNTGAYIWASIPDAISDTVKVKVVDADDIGAFDTSNDYFRITGDFTVTSPNGGEKWYVGDIENITWTSRGTMPQVRVDYSTDGGASYPYIITATNNNGQYEWLVPDTISAQVRVRVSDLADSTAFDVSDGLAKIRARFTLLSPNGGEVFTVGDAHEIIWSSVGTVAFVDLRYSTNDFATTSSIVGGTPNDGSYMWTVPDAISTNVKVRVISSTDADAYDDSDAAFKIRGALRVLSPNGGERWPIDQFRDITWQSTGTIANVDLFYSTDSGVTFPYTVATALANTGSYSWRVPDTATAYARVRVTDSSDATVTDDSDADFRIQGFFALTSPNGGESFVVGSTQAITWTWGGSLALAKLSYSTDGGETYSYIINAAAPNGSGSGGSHSYDWTIPDTISLTVRVKVEDPGDDTVYDVSNANFRIRGDLILTAPNGGERWVTRETRTITWTTTGTIPTVNLRYSKDGFVTSTLISAGVENNNAYAWSVPDDRSTTVRVRVLDPRDETVHGTSAVNFTIDYYTVTWRVVDTLTFSHLDQLTVSSERRRLEGEASSPSDFWEESGMTSSVTGIVRQFPFGSWSAKWTRMEYGDRYETFVADQDQEILVLMETQVVHIWEAQVLLSYDSSSKDIVMSATLLRDGTNLVRLQDGSLVPIATNKCEIRLFDAGTLVKTFTREGPADDIGFYHFSWPAPTGLQVGKVYQVMTTIQTLTGGSFTTPSSFSISEAEQLKQTLDAVTQMRDETLPAFQTGVQTAITLGIAEQKELIEEKMTEQSAMIDVKTTEMKDSMDQTLTSFETRTQEAVQQLQAGADQATKAGAELETIAKRQSGELILPTSVLVGGSVEVRYRNESGLVPLMDIIAFDGAMILNGQPLLESAVTRGLYGFDLLVDGARFEPGKAFTVIVTERTTGNLQAGSVMVESTSLTSIEGLAASVPQVKSAVDEALEAIQSMQESLATGGDMGQALKTLQESIDELPAIIAREGPSSQLAERINLMVERLTALAGDQGLDISGIVEEALTRSPTMIELRRKTENIRTAVDLMQSLFQSQYGGRDDVPVISTSLSSGSVIVNVVAANPSSRVQTTRVKVYLPKEVTPRDILDLGGLELEFDADKSIYYVYRDNIELQPNEVRVFRVRIEDIWIIPQTTLDILRMRVARLAAALENTEHAEAMTSLAIQVERQLQEIARVQIDETVSKEAHIGAFRTNMGTVEQIKATLTDFEKLMIRRPEEAGGLTRAMAWKVILTVIVFVGLLSAVFFFLWYRQSGSTAQTLDKARQFSFPSTQSTDKTKEGEGRKS